MLIDDVVRLDMWAVVMMKEDVEDRRRWKLVIHCNRTLLEKPKEEEKEKSNRHN